jgi:hypothetical protein
MDAMHQVMSFMCTNTQVERRLNNQSDLCAPQLQSQVLYACRSFTLESTGGLPSECRRTRPILQQDIVALRHVKHLDTIRKAHENEVKLVMRFGQC